MTSMMAENLKSLFFEIIRECELEVTKRSLDFLLAGKCSTLTISQARQRSSKQEILEALGFEFHELTENWHRLDAPSCLFTWQDFDHHNIDSLVDALVDLGILKEE